MTKTVLIVGAASAIAEAAARIYAREGAGFFLVARSASKLAAVAADLTARGASRVEQYVMDANDFTSLPKMADLAWQAFGNIDVALVAQGTLPDQARCEIDLDYAMREFHTNANSLIACLQQLAQRFEPQRAGVIAVIGSVAGDRGRRSNYLYGSAKAAVDAFASGLRARMLSCGVHVLTIKPGFVDTPMTRGLPLPGPLVASAESVAKDIVRAIGSRRDVLYTPWFWRFIMLIIVSLPTVIFKRTRI